MHNCIEECRGRIKEWLNSSSERMNEYKANRQLELFWQEVAFKDALEATLSLIEDHIDCGS